jgi:hypothetical protein
LGTYKTLGECQPVAKELSAETDELVVPKTYMKGSIQYSSDEVKLLYTCAAVPKAYIYE